MDEFQKKYLAHQEHKKKELESSSVPLTKYTGEEIGAIVKVITQRRSRRVFKEEASDEIIGHLRVIADLAPSSCNRKGVYLKRASRRLINMLVGGKGWADKGTVLAFYADMECYKSPYEKDFMPYLDTGFMAQNIYLACEVLGIGCCFINPNTHNKYKSKHLLTGLISIGIC